MVWLLFSPLLSIVSAPGSFRLPFLYRRLFGGEPSGLLANKVGGLGYGKVEGGEGPRRADTKGGAGSGGMLGGV